MWLRTCRAPGIGLFGGDEDCSDPLRSTAVSYIYHFFNMVPHSGPYVIALIICVVKLHSKRRQLPARSFSLARSGLVVLLADMVLSLVWQLVYLELLTNAISRSSVGPINMVNLVVGGLLSALTGGGLLLLVAALFAAGSPGQDDRVEPYTGEGGHGAVAGDRPLS